MSQQEFVPEPQNQDEQILENGQKNEYKSYYWSTTPHSGNIPKDEHPSTFEASLPAYSYPAQDTRQGLRREAEYAEGQAREYRTETRSYQGQRRFQAQVPSWARPQRHAGKPIMRILGIVLLAIVLIKAIPIMLALAAALIGALAFVLLLPIIILLAILIPFAIIAIVILSALGISLGGLLRPRRHSWSQRWR
ncbi:hypothetical protein EPA93_31885 [Ktedonosporobacter rubrisoli]|uniref:Uncharacterized protein n=1 Tax=Ktedonosporobacter rubrisoli TaxID=2509675 RepID=A0A4P6JXW8_KTERU|nr:hypothetical protein [Ktedonosporobacter rubrisoli]QBD80325.1 hypothetical protein EPA93_31885 [Ktedonosporobacter rubrisoli]